MQPSNLKALFRRGVARNALGRCEDAVVDLEEVPLSTLEYPWVPLGSVQRVLEVPFESERGLAGAHARPFEQAGRG